MSTPLRGSSGGRTSRTLSSPRPEPGIATGLAEAGTPSGLPDEAEDEDVPLGVPADEDEVDRELPGFPEGDIDTAG